MAAAAKDEEEVVSDLPANALYIKNILKSLGVTKYESQVVHQLLNFLYRHVANILKESEIYATKTGVDDEIGMEDVLLAIKSNEAFCFNRPPPQDVLTEMATRVNALPLPDLREGAGVLMPRDSLIGPSFQLNTPVDNSLDSDADADSGSKEFDHGCSLIQNEARTPPITIKLASPGRAEMDVDDDFEPPLKFEDEGRDVDVEAGMKETSSDLPLDEGPVASLDPSEDIRNTTFESQSSQAKSPNDMDIDSVVEEF